MNHFYANFHYFGPQVEEDEENSNVHTCCINTGNLMLLLSSFSMHIYYSTQEQLKAILPHSRQSQRRTRRKAKELNYIFQELYTQTPGKGG